MKPQDELQGMRLLAEFQTDHSAFGQFVLLHSSFADTMASVCPAKTTDYPDQRVMIRLNVAKDLINELQKRVDYIEAGIEHNEFKILD